MACEQWILRLKKRNLAWMCRGLYDTHGELIIKCEKSRGLIVWDRVTNRISAHSHGVMGSETENMMGTYLINVIFLQALKEGSSVQRDLYHAQWDVLRKRGTGMRGMKSAGTVEETGRVKGSRKISGLIDMHEKPNGSYGILETAVDEDV